MNSEDKFKKQLEEKLNSKEFSFDEMNWHSMRGMIDESRNKKKRRVLLLLLFLVGLLGSVSFYLFNYSDHPAKLASNRVSTPPPSIDNSASAVDDQGADNAPAPTNKPDEQVESANAKTEVQETTARTEEQPENKPATRQQAENNTVAAIRTSQTITKQTQKTKQKQAAGPLVPETTKNESVAVLTPIAPLAETKRTEAPPVAEGGETAVIPGQLSDQSDSKVFAPDQASTSDKAKDNADLNEKPAVASEEKPNAIEPTAVDSVLTPVVAAVAETKKDSVLSPVVAKPLLSDSSSYVKHVLSLEAGTNYMAGWNVNDKKDGKGFNLVAGINYMYFVKPKLGLSAGIHYTSVRNLSAFSHTSTITKYGFGEKTDVTVITPEKIHYLQLPLKINVRLNDKNYVGAGYTLGYLLTVNSKTEKHSNGFNYATGTTTGKARGYTEGFSSFDSQVSVFYRRMIYKKLFINAEAMFGLTDTRKNTFFSSPSAERNIGLKLTLMYNIFQK